MNLELSGDRSRRFGFLIQPFTCLGNLHIRQFSRTPEHRAAAPALNASLDWAEATLPRTPMTVDELAAGVTARIADARGAEIQSVDIRDAETLAPLAGAITAPAVILLAVRFGQVLLIDQRVVRP